MKNQITFLTLFIVFCFCSLRAQVSEEWVQRYSGPGYADNATSLAVDASGNVYVTGYSPANGSGLDYVTIKYNSSGVQQWIQKYNGPGESHDAAFSLAVDDLGNVYVTGWSIGSGTYPGYATIKYNSSGIQLWVARYNGPGNIYDGASSLAVDDSGNVYVTGYSVGSENNTDYATIKYNSSGDSIWVARYNGPDNFDDDASSLAVDDSGNVYVTGSSIGNEANYDYATIKYNSSGVQQWVQRYMGPGKGLPNYDYANSLAVDCSGNVYVTGQSTGSGDRTDYATIKYNSSGDSVWVQRYDGGASSLAVDDSGNVYVTGFSNSAYATIKYNSSGVQQWVQRYHGPGNGGSAARSLAVDGSGNVYVTGGSLGNGTNSDYATIKYNSSGDSLWVVRYNGPGNSIDGANSLAVDGSGNVYVTGESIGSGTGPDYATIKYSQLTGIPQTYNSIPEKFSLLQNYPNPFNPNTVISYQLSVNSFASLKVYDILGNEIAVLVNEKQNAGSYSVQWDASNFSSGIYFYKLENDGNIIDTKRMVLLK